MDSAQKPFKLTVADYLEGEKASQTKHEYVHGEVWAMAGASRIHGTITMNLGLALTAAVRKKGCDAYASDMKFKVDDNTYYYPDFMICCNESPDEYFYDKPCVVIEVISKSTARIDQNEKRYAYTNNESLQLYLLVDSRKQAVRAYYRTKQGWQERVFAEHESVPIPCADSELSLEEIYLQTPLAPSA